MEKQQLLRDANIVPTDERIALCLGAANPTFVALIDKLKQLDITLMEWRYYRDGKAWLSKGEYKWTTARGTDKTTPIFWLSIWDGFFKLSFFFTHNLKTELLKLPLSDAAKALVERADLEGAATRFMPLIFDIENDFWLCDVLTVATFKKLLK